MKGPLYLWMNKGSRTGEGGDECTGEEWREQAVEGFEAQINTGA